MIKYSEIRKKFDVENMNGEAEDFAFLTHYMQNVNNDASKLYEKRARKVLYKKSNVLNLIKEPELEIMFPIKWDIPFPEPKLVKFTFIDLFAGIGGFRIPLQNLGGKCVFSSENNYHAQRAYEYNFGEVPFGDITKLNKNLVPQHDILCAGFPCQPFSISGKMKGFEDTRGTLIYDVFEIIKKRKPNVVLLENVKHLIYHDSKRTLSVIVKHLEELGYIVSQKVLNASDFGIPQNRERIIIIGHRKKHFDFSKIKTNPKPTLKDFLDNENIFEYLDEPFTIIDNPKRQKSGLIFAGFRNKTLRKVGVRPNTEHLSRVHKQPNRIYSTEGVHPTIPSQETSGRFWIWHQSKVRKLTINECYRIMGFPDNYRFIYSKNELYKQIGNSVAIPMIKAVTKQIIKQLLN